MPPQISSLIPHVCNHLTLRPHTQAPLALANTALDCLSKVRTVFFKDAASTSESVC